MQQKIKKNKIKIKRVKGEFLFDFFLFSVTANGGDFFFFSFIEINKSPTNLIYDNRHKANNDSRGEFLFSHPFPYEK